eukprot:6819886-Prymnesium_polylepis.3
MALYSGADGRVPMNPASKSSRKSRSNSTAHRPDGAQRVLARRAALEQCRLAKVLARAQHRAHDVALAAAAARWLQHGQLATEQRIQLVRGVALLENDVAVGEAQLGHQAHHAHLRNQGYGAEKRDATSLDKQTSVAHAAQRDVCSGSAALILAVPLGRAGNDRAQLLIAHGVEPPHRTQHPLQVRLRDVALAVAVKGPEGVGEQIRLQHVAANALGARVVPSQLARRVGLR